MIKELNKLDNQVMVLVAGGMITMSEEETRNEIPVLTPVDTPAEIAQIAAKPGMSRLATWLFGMAGGVLIGGGAWLVYEYPKYIDRKMAISAAALGALAAVGCPLSTLGCVGALLYANMHG